MARLSELRDEFRTVFAGRGPGLLDAVLPVIVYLLFSRLFDLETGIWSALGISILFLIYRIFRGQPIIYSLVGLIGAALPGGAAYLSGGESGFFLPGLITGSLTVVLLLISLLVNRPLAAYSSHLTRNWPIAWYWHPRIRPAYSEVTLFWVIGFGARLGLEYWLFSAGKTISLGLVKTFLGWPYTIMILILSYLYGIWRLGRLAGPSVDEYKAGASEPWQGQQRGF